MAVYYYTIKHLLKEFERQGLKVSRSWLYRQEEKGNLVMQRSTTNFKKAQGKRKIGAVRILTDLDIKGIIKAFLPNGKGFYSCNKSISTSNTTSTSKSTSTSRKNSPYSL